VPPWFSRLAAPFIADHLAHLYRHSVHMSHVPLQWKCATITPVPKISSPVRPADYRPISVLPLYTLLEELLIRRYIYPLFLVPPLSLSLGDQYAFRPTGSTTAAIIGLIHHTTTMLATEPFVHIISLDFSKAFDVARHETLFDKLSDLPLPDSVYSWLLSFFTNRSHRTKFSGVTSSQDCINSSVVQGSALGPPMFVISTSDLKVVTPGNVYVKYADDATLIVPASNTSSIPDELANVEAWSRRNNQALNRSKTAEMVVSCRWTRGLVLPPLLDGVSRADTLLLLGVVLDKHLLFAQHVTRSLAQAAQSMYALKVLQTSGLPQRSLDLVCRATLVARIMYASPCWWGAISAADRARLQATLDRVARWGLCSWPPLQLADLCVRADRTLFGTILAGGSHVLLPLLPPPRQHNYNLRQRAHNLTVPMRDKFTDLNFLRRMLFGPRAPN